MPFMMAPMPCSRMPKCSTRPASGSPVHWSVERLSGMKDEASSIVVLLDSARSAEPPHSSGITPATALITAPDALRVATPLGSASKVGSASASPTGSARVCMRSKVATTSSDAARFHASKRSCHAACCSLPRATS